MWAAAERFRIEDGQPVPLALGSAACLWRRAADEALAAAPRATRGLVFSKNFSAVGTVVRAGLAATTLPASMVGEGLRVMGPDDGPARAAADTHGPHPRARARHRGNEGDGRGDPHDCQRARPQGGMKSFRR